MRYENSFHEKIKKQTKPFHDALEKLYLTDALVQNSLNLDEYREYLKRLYKVHTTVEPQFFNFDWSGLKIDIDDYLRQDMLASDLKMLGVDTKSPEKNSFEFESFDAALGGLYVLTGSVMGGKILAQRVEQNPNLPDVNSYFKAFNENTMSLWIELMQAITFYVEENEAEEEVIEGAKKFYSYIYKSLDG